MRENVELLLVTIVWLSIMGICLFLAVGRLLQLKSGRIYRLILVTACGFLGGMVIYLADWGILFPRLRFL